MAKWFREFPINLKTGTDRIRPASESGSQSRGKPGLVPDIGTKAPSSKGGVGASVSGRHRNNSAVELGRSGSTIKDGKFWDSLLPGKSRKHSKAEVPVFDEPRSIKSSFFANAYMGRLVKVDKQDHLNTGRTSMPTTVVPDMEKTQPNGRTDTVIILEDYADPFDAQKTREQRDAEREGENDGYIEPYDAQQMISEIRRRCSKDLLKMCVLVEGGVVGEGDEGRPVPSQIYDVPYEGGSGGEGERVMAPVARPELDNSPAAEYEMLWECKKDQIVTALTAQFDYPECLSTTKDNPSHFTLTRQPQQLSQHMTRQKSWNQKILKSSPTISPSPSSPTGLCLEAEVCRIDPTLPIEKQSWYHGCVTRQEAESQLQACKEASFLVRNSESGTSKYSIALKTSHGCVHIIVAQTKGCGYTLDQSSCVFPSIPEVVHHYGAQRLPFNGAEHMTLLHPVHRPDSTPSLTLSPH
ncbi:hypothetical protein DPEC_G00203740 [Dallia pectoralis]|uniref:Uncharacterized protein n=1 Tax=Dallia pectoralis TaxID=75939 RepID=A0ACC2G9N2_DALPE|nr:hypothetical protein DPEC_G00203740 [Dallia pectoralis]